MSYRFCFKVSTSTSFTTINNESDQGSDDQDRAGCCGQPDCAQPGRGEGGHG